MNAQVNTKLVRLAALLAGMSFIGGCATIQGPTQGDNESYAPIMPVPSASRQAYNGAIYQTGAGLSLFTDNKARHVGDVLTIVLSENTNASKSANTSTSKESDIALPDPTIFGGPVTINGRSILNNSINTETEFDGQGSSTQSNQLTGYITVTVAEVLANGNLVVQGEKWLELNQGKEFVRFRGIVRSSDVQPDNTIDSTKVANAQIYYGGTGALADANAQGWLGRFFNSKVWPF
jgi:flagellar L-ring protein precursor FlgH